MAKPEADRRCVEEAQEALGCLVVTGSHAAGALQLVEAALDKSPQPVEGAVHRHAQLAGPAHWDNRHDVARLNGFANLRKAIAMISPPCQSPFANTA
jgi:hypothetical protein